MDYSNFNDDFDVRIFEISLILFYSNFNIEKKSFKIVFSMISYVKISYKLYIGFVSVLTIIFLFFSMHIANGSVKEAKLDFFTLMKNTNITSNLELNSNVHSNSTLENKVISNKITNFNSNSLKLKEFINLTQSNTTNSTNNNATNTNSSLDKDNDEKSKESKSYELLDYATLLLNSSLFIFILLNLQFYSDIFISFMPIFFHMCVFYNSIKIKNKGSNFNFYLYIILLIEIISYAFTVYKLFQNFKKNDKKDNDDDIFEHLLKGNQKEHTKNPDLESNNSKDLV